MQIQQDSDSFVCLLVNLGQILTHKQESTEWLSIRKVSGLCRTHQYELKSRVNRKPGDLQDQCQIYFGDQHNGDIRANGVKISQRTNTTELRKCPAPYELKFERFKPSH